ncbi:MAG: glycosyltransferase [Candidatus Coatesbacteria bacterium]
MRVALVHDWLNGMRGGEKVLEQLCLLYPQADIHTLLCEPAKISGTIRKHQVKVSFVQRLPGSRRWYRWYLPLFPAAIESFDLAGYDLVISCSHCVALGAMAPANALHLCYCLTPMRYAWDHFHSYFPPERYSWPVRSMIGWWMTRLRTWDVSAAQRVGRFVGISHFVAKRINRHYRREAGVIYPPADTDYYTPGGARGDFHLVVSALVPYKRVDLAVTAFTECGKPLVVIGEGPERGRLERLAGPTVKFLGWRSDAEVRDHYRAARSLVFPGEEDFGITPVEAAACGTPTIAYMGGGALETVREGITGVLFPEQTVACLRHAVEACEAARFDPATMREHALGFSNERFRGEFEAEVAALLAARHQADLGKAAA